MTKTSPVKKLVRAVSQKAVRMDREFEIIERVKGQVQKEKNFFKHGRSMSISNYFKNSVQENIEDLDKQANLLGAESFLNVKKRPQSAITTAGGGKRTHRKNHSIDHRVNNLTLDQRNMDITPNTSRIERPSTAAQNKSRVIYNELQIPHSSRDQNRTLLKGQLIEMQTPYLMASHKKMKKDLDFKIKSIEGNIKDIDK
jgi:hypothetical protein